MKITATRAGALALALLGLAGCAGQASRQLPVPEESRVHDSRSFRMPEAGLAFPALASSSIETDRWSGVLGGAGYRIEVPKNWNGMLVMYTHGYVGTGQDLRVTNPEVRRHLVENGYAWAASSYSKNYYDVRAGVEDTNALALAFTKIAAEKGRTLAEPKKIYIMGRSMGGHIAAAAVEQETLRTAINKVRYSGAVPVCGVLGDTELFNYFAAYQTAAQHFAGMPATTFPTPDFEKLRPALVSALWTSYPATTTPQGDKLKAAVMHLTGGPRPIFEEGFRIKVLQDILWNGFGADGTINGILNRNNLDTTRIVYQLDSDPAISAEEAAFNRDVFRIKGTPDANRQRSDGLRWIPAVNGQFDVPVVTLHTLGDMYVPFRMEQLYNERARANGSDKWLVQRAIRAPSHCDFSVAEQVAAFQAMADWEQRGVKPSGDDVMTQSVVADPNYGCTYTINTPGPDDLPALATVRPTLPACTKK
ncbi:MAG TPA: alpha/beta hydrolase [Noviherbaspirillum sp.]|jgi:acetyl esterase/lipase|uniref:alpha/beta hydrolase family protein n=1 Tax=Noviherbaspirillum sp. TaxID=1926288 RepID=UPI002F95425A